MLATLCALFLPSYMVITSAAIFSGRCPFYAFGSASEYGRVVHNILGSALPTLHVEGSPYCTGLGFHWTVMHAGEKLEGSLVSTQPFSGVRRALWRESELSSSKVVPVKACNPLCLPVGFRIASVLDCSAVRQ
jgi:hypothetical protein